MAKKPLYGGQNEPHCEACALGKRSSDGSTVLCQRGGAVPTYHHCRHYRYDPLRRTPRRQKALDNFSAADFSLGEADDWIEVATGKSAPVDSTHSQLLKRLRAYLNSTATPDVQTILDILADDPNALEDDKAILLAEAQALVNAEQPSVPADEPTPADEPVLTAPTEEAPAEDAPSVIAPPTLLLIPDDSEDIFGDLERLSVTMATAAYEPALYAASADENDGHDTPSYTDAAPAMLTLPDGDDPDEDAILSADDVILLSAQDLADDF